MYKTSDQTHKNPFVFFFRWSNISLIGFFSLLFQFPNVRGQS